MMSKRHKIKKKLMMVFLVIAAIMKRRKIIAVKMDSTLSHRALVS